MSSEPVWKGIHSVVASGNTGFRIDLQAFADRHPYVSKCEPYVECNLATFPSARYRECMGGPVASVFSSGAVVIAGHATKESAKEYFLTLVDILRGFEEEVE